MYHFMLDLARKVVPLHPLNGQVSYGQLPVNPPGAHKRKNREGHGMDFSVEVGLCSLS